MTGGYTQTNLGTQAAGSTAVNVTYPTTPSVNIKVASVEAAAATQAAWTTHATKATYLLGYVLSGSSNASVTGATMASIAITGLVSQAYLETPTTTASSNVAAAVTVMFPPGFAVLLNTSTAVNVVAGTGCRAGGTFYYVEI